MKKIIYIQKCTDGEVTWCEDQINDDDIPYIKVEIYAALVAKNTQMQDALESARKLIIFEDDNLHYESDTVLVKIDAALLAKDN